jgi:hypothetical protein
MRQNGHWYSSEAWLYIARPLTQALSGKEPDDDSLDLPERLVSDRSSPAKKTLTALRLFLLAHDDRWLGQATFRRRHTHVILHNPQSVPVIGATMHRSLRMRLN